MLQVRVGDELRMGSFRAGAARDPLSIWVHVDDIGYDSSSPHPKDSATQRG